VTPSWPERQLPGENLAPSSAPTWDTGPTARPSRTLQQELFFNSVKTNLDQDAGPTARPSRILQQEQVALLESLKMYSADQS
jgi:hypothetical protein